MNADKYKILFAEDDSILNSTLYEELITAGYDVTSVSDGQTAIENIEAKPVDIAILDIEMPKVNGFEVLQYIKGNHPEVKVIMLTGYADLQNAVKAKKLGSDSFAEKPYDLNDLLSTIRQLLSN
jgi:DNA-binding NtrC family response regulator